MGKEIDSLTFDALPRVVEKEKDRDAGLPVTGAAVAQAALVRALLSYGTYERYYVLADAFGSREEAEQRLSQYPGRERAQLVRAQELAGAARSRGMILFGGSSVLQSLTQLRKIHGRADWPVVGVTHALSYLLGIPHALFMLLDEFYEHDGVICTSRAGRRALRNIFRQLAGYLGERRGVSVSFPGQLPVIPLGVDAPRLPRCGRAEARERLGIRQGRVVFLYLGRFSAADKADLFPLVHTFASCFAGRKGEALLVLAGNDTVRGMAPKLAAFAQSLGAAEEVAVMPDISSEDKAALYAAADVFVSLSDSVQETFGLTVVEAMAAGLPVIASDWSGYRESVVHGSTGFLVPTYWGGEGVDSVSRLSAVRSEAATHWMLGQSVCVDMAAAARYMRALSENPELRAAMGEAGLARFAAHYSWPVIVAQYEAFWEALGERSRGLGAEGRSFRHGLCSYDFLRVFGHYATGAVAENDLLRATSEGEQFLGGELCVEPLEQTMSPPERGLCDEIIAACRNDAGLKKGALLDTVMTKAAVPLETASQVLARLIKYGMVERMPSIGDE